VAVARSSSDGNAICYVLPVSWITSRFHIMVQRGPYQTRRCFVEFARWRHRGEVCRLQLHLVLTGTSLRWIVTTQLIDCLELVSATICNVSSGLLVRALPDRRQNTETLHLSSVVSESRTMDISHTAMWVKMMTTHSQFKLALEKKDFQ